jgi:hypothetical protein
MTVPAGYERAEVRGVEVVARAGLVEAIRTALKAGTLYEYAAQHEEARSLAGRGIAYSVPLPTGDRVVVRHNRHGGLLAPLTGDRFLTPTRAPHELSAALRLAKAGVPTPELVAYVVYRVGPLLRRCDVATREIRDSRDLAAVLTGDDAAERRAGLDAAAALIGALSAAGARHHDLNIKNVLLARTGGNSRSGGAFRAYVLDVDRMEFGRPGDSRITENNLDRFARSVRKWRDLYGARVDEGDLARVAASVRRVVSTPPSPRRPASVRS